MKRSIFLILSFLVLELQAAAQAPRSAQKASPSETIAQRYIEIVTQSEPLSSSVVGIMALKVSGDTVAYMDGMRRMVPASNMKLITTGVALKELGANYRWETSLAYSGEIRDGVLEGDLYIVGGGDPTTASGDEISQPVEKLFSSWTEKLSEAGVKKISGRVIGDGRWFDGPIENDTWQSQDLGTYYGAGGNGLCFYRNILDVNVSAGASVGDSVTLSPVYPDTPWMKYTNTSVTSAAGTGDNLFLFNTDLAPVAEMRGTFAIDRKPKKEQCSNKFGALTCAYYFRNFLIEKGIQSSGYADVDAFGRIRDFATDGGEAATAQADLSIIGKFQSPALAKVEHVTNHVSDNFYAETLMRTVGKVKGGSASYEAAKKAFMKVFAQMKLPSSGIQIADGSGLSRKNYVSPEFFCSFLKAMMDAPVFEQYLLTLGQPGKGAYSGRLSGEREDLKSRIFYKSGSMDGVRCFSGYVRPRGDEKEDTIVFSVMLNNCTAPSWKINSLIDKIIALIASEN